METYFSTPILDEESSGLLKMISEHGGYAYVSMLAQAATGDARAAEAAREMAWEQLHSGPWHSVLPVWRDAFSMACLHVARHHCRDGEFKEALRVLDMGVIMGGPLLRKDLDSAIETVSFRARVREGEKNGERAGASSENGRRLVSEEEFDKAELLRILPNRSLSCKIVVKRSGLSLEGFLREYFLSGSPVIITDCMAHWPARTKWNDIDYLKRVAGDRTVPVEVGKNYLCPEWKQELIPFSQFLERIRLTGNSSDVLTYLAQHPLFDQINELRKDICIPDYCFAGGGELRSLNAWFGPVGTVTPLHHDPHHNILAQVVGKKYVRLYPASLLEELYPYTETMLCNSSQISLEALLGEMIWGEGFDDLGKVAANIGSSAMLNFPVHLAASVNGSRLIPAKQKVDLDHIDDSQFPKVNDLDFFDCILNEGEMIYIPPKWWHYVRSLSISLSVSFWWGSDAGGSTSS